MYSSYQVFLIISLISLETTSFSEYFTKSSNISLNAFIAFFAAGFISSTSSIFSIICGYVNQKFSLYVSSISILLAHIFLVGVLMILFIETTSFGLCITLKYQSKSFISFLS
jgi:hypothetical protein